MPYIHKMADTHCALNEKKLPQHDSGAHVEPPPGTAVARDTPQATSNGVPQQDGPAESGQVGSGPSSSVLDLPPELARMTQNYWKFGMLVDRVAQICYKDLEAAIDQMAEINLPPQTNGATTNGMTNHVMLNGAVDNTTQSNQKKQILMEFANVHKERFIQLLVLSGWSRDVDEVNKLVDLMTWMGHLFHNHDEAASWLIRLRRDMQPGKMPNPDISTALEILRTGKASWLPHLNYLPPEPLTARKMLKTLRHMDAVLTIRLNLHEELPFHLRNWKVSSGRVTFSIPSQFELDVSVADEDPSSQFWFIDVRFLFKPAPDIPDSRIRATLEETANSQLRESGISGCCDFLLNFVQGHKITVLRRQALRLSRGKWTGSVKAEKVRRSLTVQYWTERPGPKSWIEFGVGTGKSKTSRSQSYGEVDQYQLGLRWFRHGKEVSDQLAFDEVEISMERLLQHVTALHATYILERTRAQLKASPNTRLATDLQTSTTDASECELSLRLEDCRAAIKIDAISGHLSITPQTAISESFERDINRFKDLAADAHTRLNHYLCAEVQAHTEAAAEKCAWDIKRNPSLRKENVKAALFQEDGLQSIFRCPGWTGPWALAAHHSLRGRSWYIVRTTRDGLLDRIVRAIRLNTSLIGRPNTLTQDFLRGVANMAIVDVSYLVTKEQLNITNVPSYIGPPSPPRAKSQSSTSSIYPVLWVETDRLLGKATSARADGRVEVVRICHHSFEDGGTLVVHMLKGFRRSPKFQGLPSGTSAQDLEFIPDGSFSMQLRRKFGESIADQIVSRLQTLACSTTITTILHKKKMQRNHATPSSVSFTYNPENDLSAEVGFPPKESLTLKVYPEDNPHRRIQQHLTTLLNSKGFEIFVPYLQQTLPLLRGLDTIESRNHASAQPTQSTYARIHPHDVNAFTIYYHPSTATRSGLYDLVLEAKLRQHRNQNEWHVGAHHQGAGQKERKLNPNEEAIQTKLKEFFKQGGDGWKSMGRSAVATVVGVKTVLEKIDELVREAVASVPAAPAASTAQTAPAAPTALAGKKNGTGKGDAIVLD